LGVFLWAIIEAPLQVNPMHTALLVPSLIRRNINIRVPQDFATPQEALDSLRGTTCMGVAIIIAAGTYDQHLVIRDIALLGDPSADTGDVPYEAARFGLAIRMENYADRIAPAVTVRGITSQVGNVAVCGIRANMNGITNLLNWGFGAINRGRLFCYDCLADNVAGVTNPGGSFGFGFLAQNGGMLRSYRGIARNCTHGFGSLRGSLLLAPLAVAENNKSWQFYSGESSSLWVPNSSGRGPYGYYSIQNSALYADSSTFVGTLAGSSYCALATIGSRLSCSSCNFSVGFIGVYSDVGSVVVANNTRCTGLSYGFFSTTGGTIHCASAIAQNDTVGYYAATAGVIYAYTTSANNAGNTTNYSPATSGVFGNTNGQVMFS
jgi:hypothetical protein